MLEIRNLQVAYGDVTAVWDISLTVKPGELVAVVGPNGAGKTTLLNALSGIIPAKAGEIDFEGRSIKGIPAHKRAALGLVQSPEGRKLFPEMTVEENLRMGGFTCRDAGEIQRRMAQVFGMFPKLEERRTQLANTMSGGEQQMTAIARALMAKPRILMLDEPSLGLAPIVVAEMFDYIRQIQEQGTTILIVEQNVLQTLEIADRAYVIENGHIALQGSAREVLDNPHTRSAYLGMQ